MAAHFRQTARGEIVVFETSGVPKERREAQYPPMPSDEFYIKRLVGLGGETISLKQDYEVTNVLTFRGETKPVGHLVVNGQPLSASTPHFENVYGFNPKKEPAESQYSGHTRMWRFLEGAEYPVSDKQFLVFGDNTVNSLDSRYWGDFAARNVIGRAFCVYWPLTTRFGWSCMGH